MLGPSGEILIGNPTGYNSGSSVQRPITRKMIRRSIFNMRSENVMSGPFPLPAIHALREAPSGGRGSTHPPRRAFSTHPTLRLLGNRFPGTRLALFLTRPNPAHAETCDLPKRSQPFPAPP